MSKPNREQRNEARNAIWDAWAAGEYRDMFANVGPFAFLKAIDDAIDALWAVAAPAVPGTETTDVR